MPSIELIGYSETEKAELLRELRIEFSECDFRDEIIFVSYQAEVRGFHDDNQAFLRVCTRNESKAKQLMARLKKYADVEFLKSHEILFKDS